MKNFTFAVASLVLLGACTDHQGDLVGPVIEKEAATAAAGIGEHGGGIPGGIVFTHRPESGFPVELWRMNPDGSGQQQLTHSSGRVANITPDWSPNGRKIAFASTRTGDEEVFVINADGSEATNLSNDPGVDRAPVWSPNGKQIAFHSNRDGDYELYVMEADGSNVRQLTTHTGVDQYPEWSPDGRQIVFQRDGDIWRLDVHDGTATRLWDDPVFADMPAFSPNGKQIAFMSRSQGGCAIFVTDADGGSPVNLTPKPADVPAAGWCNYFPSWSKDGQQIYFGSWRPETDSDGEIFAINADGSELTRLTYQPGLNSAPVAR